MDFTAFNRVMARGLSQGSTSLVRDVFIEQFVQESKNEVHWRVLDMDHLAKKQPELGMMILGDKLAFFHMPYCRCPECPLHQDLALTKARFVDKTSPFKGFQVDPNAIYFQNQGHLNFCQCEECTDPRKRPLVLVLKTMEKKMSQTLLASPYDVYDLASNEDEMRPDLVQYRNVMVKTAIQHWETLTMNGANLAQYG